LSLREQLSEARFKAVQHSPVGRDGGRVLFQPVAAWVGVHGGAFPTAQQQAFTTPSRVPSEAGCGYPPPVERHVGNAKTGEMQVQAFERRGDEILVPHRDNRQLQSDKLSDMVGMRARRVDDVPA